MECVDQAMENGRLHREQDVLGNCGTVPRNSADVDDKYNRLCVIEMVSVLDPDTWMSRDVYSLDGVFDVR